MIKKGDFVISDIDDMRMVKEFGSIGSLVMETLLFCCDENKSVVMSKREISDILGVSERTVFNVIQDLISKGAIRKDLVVRDGSSCSKFTILDERFELIRIEDED